MTPEESQAYWNEPVRHHTDIQVELINTAQFKYWAKGNSVPTDLFMKMTEAGLDADRLQDLHINR